MPTYDYLCEACGHELEMFQSITASPARKCPSCGALKLRRQIGAGGGLIFKGSGFYITDYRSSEYKQKAEAESKAAGGSGPESAGESSDKGEAAAGDGKKAPAKKEKDSKKDSKAAPDARSA